MPVVSSAAQFLDHLGHSRLMTADQIAGVLAELKLEQETDPLVVAKKFVAAGHLTRLQGTRLLEGRHRGFFIDHYRIDEILGSGGMGWVYIAKDLRTNEDVALKMLCDQNEKDAGLLTRFRLEAEAGRKLDHHAIIKTREIGHAVGLFGEIHYMVMDLFKGVGVDEFVSMAGPIPPPLACHIARHVAAGLHHAHRAGLVHRDIKPANVLVDEQANSRILDFGLSVASQAAQDDEFSLAMIFGQDCLGTADYIAPEQAHDSFSVDRRADIYSLGGTLYFMLCGHVMFPQCKTRAEKIAAQESLNPTPIRELVPTVSEAVAQILDKMLAKKRNDRFESAKEVSQALAPHAVPKRVLFDFQSILDRRFQIAQQRQKLLDERAKRAAAATSLSMCSLDSRTTRPTHAGTETVIPRDTQVGPVAKQSPQAATNLPAQADVTSAAKKATAKKAVAKKAATKTAATKTSAAKKSP